MEGWLASTSVGTPGASPVPECGITVPEGCPYRLSPTTQPVSYHIDTTYLSRPVCDGGNRKKVATGA